MSDEYASSGSGFKGSLVNPCTCSVHPLHTRSSLIACTTAINDIVPPRERESTPLFSDYATKNYPPPGDSTHPVLFLESTHSHTHTSIQRRPQEADVQVPPTAPALPDRLVSSRRTSPNHSVVVNSIIIVMRRASIRVKRRLTRSLLGITLLASDWAEWVHDY